MTPPSLRLALVPWAVCVVAWVAAAVYQGADVWLAVNLGAWTGLLASIVFIEVVR